MATYPAGIITRDVTYGSAFKLIGATDLLMEVSITPTRSLVWNGQPAINTSATVKTTILGSQGLITLPVTDQTGWKDGQGGTISVANGAQSHYYRVSIRYLDANNVVVASKDPFNFPVPTGDGPIDLDNVIALPTTGGVTISVPDTWTQIVTAARDAATASAASAATAAAAATAAQNPKDGKDGSNVLTGSGVPTLTAAENDSYVDVATGDVYKRSSNTWSKTGSVRGPSGPDGFRPASIDFIRRARGENWSGMEYGLRGPTLAELKEFRTRGFNSIRLPISWFTAREAVRPVLIDGVTAGVRIEVTRHTYGRVGGVFKPLSAIQQGDVVGTLVDPTDAASMQMWKDCVQADLLAWGDIPSYICGDWNEPAQFGQDVEAISLARQGWISELSYDYIVGYASGGGGSSAAAVNNSSVDAASGKIKGHPNGFWINDPKAYLHVHYYPSGWSDAGYTTVASRNAYAVSLGYTDYNQLLALKGREGFIGTEKWRDVPTVFGEVSVPRLNPSTAVTSAADFAVAAQWAHTVMNMLDNRTDSTGTVPWGSVGMWWWAEFRANASSTNPGKILEQERRIISSHFSPGSKGVPGLSGTNGSNGTGFNPRGAWAGSTAYAINDIVTYGGSTYRAKAAFTSTSTFNPANWDVWAAQGATGLPGPALALALIPDVNQVQPPEYMVTGAGGAVANGQITYMPFYTARGGLTYDAFVITATSAQVAGAGSGFFTFALHPSVDPTNPKMPDTTVTLATATISSQTSANTNVVVPFSSGTYAPTQDTVVWLACMYLDGATAPTTRPTLLSVTSSSYNLPAASVAAGLNKRGYKMTGQTALPIAQINNTTAPPSSSSDITVVSLRRSA